MQQTNNSSLRNMWRKCLFTGEWECLRNEAKPSYRNHVSS